jgi:hypothetical protein
MNSFTISGIDHIIRMLNQYPQLSGLSSLAPIYHVGAAAKAAVAKTKCNCSAGPIYAANKKTFEMALNNMGNGDHLIVKNLLKVDKVCFYISDNTGKRTLKCV